MAFLGLAFGLPRAGWCGGKILNLFKIIKKEKIKGRRVAVLQTIHGGVKTPVFMPVATQAAVKNLTSEELGDLGAQIILGNTYHLWLRPGTEVIKKTVLLRPASGGTSEGQGGLHKFMNWPGPILTDSGGYQIFSLARHRKISSEGVEFCDPINGKRYFLTPEKSIQIQLDLGSDIIMVFDECAAYPCSYEEAEKAVRRTTQWAKRCFKYFRRKVKNKKNKPLLFGIVQGSVFKDLRQKSAKELLEIGFSAQGGLASGWDGYAIGGVAVGEPRKYLGKVLEWVLPLLPQNKPRYLMGLGRPEEIVSAVLSGIDMFDCVIPTREARHGRIYKYRFSIFNILPEGRQFSDKKFYETLQIKSSKFAKDFRPIDENCECYACQNYSRAYLNHLFKTREPLALRLATIHNLKFYLDLMEKLREF